MNLRGGGLRGGERLLIRRRGPKASSRCRRRITSNFRSDQKANLGASILDFLQSWTENDDDDEPPRVVVTCLRRSTGEQAVISGGLECDGATFPIQGDHICPYGPEKVEIKHDLSAFLQMNPTSDIVSVHSQVRFACPSALGTNSDPDEEEPQLDDSYLLFAVRWVVYAGDVYHDVALKKIWPRTS